MTVRPKATRDASPMARLLRQSHLMIGTPAYGGMVHTDYVRTLFGFTSAGLRFDTNFIGNESLITRARNTILANFHQARHLTHLLFLDADTILPPEGLVRMLAAQVPAIGAAVALKGFDDAGNRLWNIGQCVGSNGALLRVENVGTAALLLSRAACDALVNDAIVHGRVYERPSTQRGSTDAAVHYDVFRVGVHNNVYLSEDYWVCRRLRTLGFDIVIDPTIITSHYGNIAL
ncbi:MAG: hypothetical protein P4L66_16085 [Acetobacteraceae bacterium]|nr:hypothetical protein [Acetobacteraceae bacterium]